MRSIRRNGYLGFVVAATSAGLLACGGGVSEPPPAAVPPSADSGLPEGHPVMEAPSLEAISRQTRTTEGVVQETLEGGGYTYARVLVGEEEIWVAGPATPLEVGSDIAISGATPMGGFSSPSLGRTFENLYFVGSFGSAAPPPDATTGEALEVLVGGGYTYVRAQIGETELWLAGPETEMREGDAVHWKGGLEMGEFTSSSLGRTFENIVFVGRFWVTPY